MVTYTSGHRSAVNDWPRREDRVIEAPRPVDGYNEEPDKKDKEETAMSKKTAMDVVRSKHGAFGWTELMTTDAASAKKFYTKLFGWKTEKAPMPGVKYTLIKVGDEMMGGIMGTPPDCKAPVPCWSVYVTVDDVDATAAKVKRLGGKLLHPPMDIPKVGRFCVIQDPQGATICAITYRP